MFEYQFQLMKAGVQPSETEGMTLKELRKWFKREIKYREDIQKQRKNAQK